MENFAPIIVILAIAGVIYFVTKKRKERKAEKAAAAAAARARTETPNVTPPG